MSSGSQLFSPHDSNCATFRIHTVQLATADRLATEPRPRLGTVFHFGTASSKRASVVPRAANPVWQRARIMLVPPTP